MKTKLKQVKLETSDEESSLFSQLEAAAMNGNPTKSSPQIGSFQGLQLH